MRLWISVTAMAVIVASLVACGDAKVTAGNDAASDDRGATSPPKSGDAKQGSETSDGGATTAGTSKGTDASGRGTASGAATAGEWKRPGDPKKGRKYAIKKCNMCHIVAGKRSMLNQGPEFNDKLIATVLAKIDAYDKHMGKLKADHPPIYDKNKAKIEKIIATKGVEQRFYEYMKVYVRQPNFDKAETKMLPVAGVKDSDIENVASYLLSLAKKK